MSVFIYENNSFKKMNIFTQESVSLLPSEYTQVDYIQSTGSEYINTLIYHTTNETSYFIDIEITGLLSQWSSLFGSRNAHDGPEAYYFGIQNNNSTYCCIGGTKRDPLGFTLQLNTRYSIIFSPTQVKVNDNSISISPTYNRTLYLYDYLFGGNFSDVSSTTAAEKIAAKVYAFKIYSNGILQRDFIPCYRNSDGEVGMFDLVSLSFFTNQGTGSFIKGPDVPKHTEFKKSGIYLLEENNLNTYNKVKI